MVHANPSSLLFPPTPSSNVCDNALHDASWSPPFNAFSFEAFQHRFRRMSGSFKRSCRVSPARLHPSLSPGFYCHFWDAHLHGHIPHSQPAEGPFSNIPAHHF